MEKAKEKQVMRNPLFVESINILNSLMPEDKKVSSVHSVDDVSTILTCFKTNFSSLEESTSKFVYEKYLKKRLSEMIGNFSLDLSSLKVGQVLLKDLVAKGRKIIAGYMDKGKLTRGLSKKIEEAESMMEIVRK